MTDLEAENKRLLLRFQEEVAEVIYLRKAIEEADTYARWHCPLNDTAIDGLLSIFKKALEGASK